MRGVLPRSRSFDTWVDSWDDTNYQLRIPEKLIGVSVVVLVISSILLGLRIYASSLRKAPRGWDDFLLPPAWLTLVGLVIINILYSTMAGKSKHGSEAISYELNNQLYLLEALYFIYPISSTLPRVSVISLYLRALTDKFSRISSWVTLAVIIASCLSALAFNSALVYDATTNGLLYGSNLNYILWWKFSNIPNIVADVAILLLPVRTIWVLKTSMSRKIGIAIVCLTGSLGLAASCVRTSQVFTKVHYPYNAMDSYKYMAAYYVLLLWATVECSLYFWAACLIGMRPVASKLHGRIFGSEHPAGGSTEEMSSTRVAKCSSGSLTNTDNSLGLPMQENVMDTEGPACRSHSHKMETYPDLRPWIAVETEVRVDFEPGRAAAVS